MTTADLLDRILEQLGEVRGRCPELRFGQLIATIGELARDETGHSLWDVEDGDFAAALERLALDMARRESGRAEPATALDRGGIDLEARFDEAMMQIYVRAKNEVGYNATRYLPMLHDNRGLETARILVLADRPSEGYTALWERKRLDLTVEALVLQSEWQPLFAMEPELLQRARKRLTEYGYKL